MERDKILHAQEISLELFRAMEKGNLIRPGKTEGELNAEICELALRSFGIGAHWLKRIVRSGPNTLAQYPDNPPDRTIGKDDILFVDLGPVVGDYEADIGRTYVLGNDRHKLRLKDDVEEAWYEIREWYRQHTSMKASVLYGYAVAKAQEFGWEFGGAIAGHIVGKFPHEQPAEAGSLELDIHPDNDYDIFQPDANGDQRHWILELQFIDRGMEIGGYFEQLL